MEKSLGTEWFLGLTGPEGEAGGHAAIPFRVEPREI